MKNQSKQFCSSQSFIGLKIFVLSNQQGVKEIFIGETKNLPKSFIDATRLRIDDPYLHNIFSQLEEYFSGTRKIFNVPLVTEGSEFQKKVWDELLKIPYGETKSYKDIAMKVGGEKHIRAVGKANGTNKIPIIIPCHRVVGSDGSLTGYAAGIDVKKKLLELEGSISLNLF